MTRNPLEAIELFIILRLLCLLGLTIGGSDFVFKLLFDSEITQKMTLAIGSSTLLVASVYLISTTRLPPNSKKPAKSILATQSS